MTFQKCCLSAVPTPTVQLKVRLPYRNAVFDRGSDNVLAEGATPLIRAARAADVESVKLLLEHGALVDLPNARGHTPLRWYPGSTGQRNLLEDASKPKRTASKHLKVLLEHGANINAVTGDPAKRPVTQLSDSERGAGLQPAIRGQGIVDGQTALTCRSKKRLESDREIPDRQWCSAAGSRYFGSYPL